MNSSKFLFVLILIKKYYLLSASQNDAGLNEFSLAT